jgi:hypothetical protein
MTTRVKFLFACGALAAGSLVASSAKDDYIQPVNFARDKVYRKLSSGLCSTGFDCARVLTVPAFSAERCVSVYSTQINERPLYFVTEIIPGESLWQRTDGGNHPERARDVKIKRIDAQIPAATATRVRRVWAEMLSRARPKRQPPINEVRVISTDATMMEFSIDKRRDRILWGELNVSLPIPGKRTKALVDLSEKLARYCEAKASQRRAIADDIDAEADQLLADLKKSP